MKEKVTLEEYKEQVREAIRNMNTGDATKNWLLNDLGDWVQEYLDDDWSPVDVAFARSIGFI